MKFSRKKLPKDAIATLRRVRVDVCEPHAILLAPVYVYLRNNQKFVAVKAPLQFFAPGELEKLQPYESFYVPEFIDMIAPFQKAGESVRALLEMNQKSVVRSNQGAASVVLPLSPHEINDAVLQVLGPLWSGGVRVEPFFLCFFADEVCRPIPSNVMVASVEVDVESFELALLRSSAAVFLALHLGYCDLGLLNRLRGTVFEDTWNGKGPAQGFGELAQLSRLLAELLPSSETREIQLDRIREIAKGTSLANRCSRKLISRLDRIEINFHRSLENVASIFGDKGFCDE